jgi:LPS sulfotransferase NodH
MKLMYDQLWHNPSVLIHMMRHRVRVVHLVRVNLLDILLSEETAVARQRPHAWEGDVVETPAVTLDPKKAASWLKTLERRVKIARCMLTLLPIKHFEVSYEHLMANPSLVDDIVTFLDVSMPPNSPTLVSRFKKLNTCTKPDLIANYAEIARALRGTRFERFLDE